MKRAHSRATKRSDARSFGACCREHGLRQHLRAELDILCPRVAVAVGVPAATGLAALEGQWRVMSIKAQGASDEEALAIRDEIRTLCSAKML